MAISNIKAEIRLQVLSVGNKKCRVAVTTFYGFEMDEKVFDLEKGEGINIRLTDDPPKTISVEDMG